jgi:endonuclease/exonuclease/phosphatase family metal-dependent hydrolase
MITRLADLSGLTYAFGKTIDYQGGEYGTAFLTGFPIYEERNILLRTYEEREQRGALILVLGVNGEELVVVTTHFDSAADSTARIANAEELMSLLRTYSTRPILLCGDFNDVPESPVVTRLKEEYLDVWELSAPWKGFTYPAESPAKRIDYVFLKKPRKADPTSALSLRPVSARVVRSSASDHVPLIVEFELTTER